MGPFAYSDDSVTSFPSRSSAWTSGTRCPLGIPVFGARAPARSSGGALDSLNVGAASAPLTDADAATVVVAAPGTGAASPDALEQLAGSAASSAGRVTRRRVFTTGHREAHRGWPLARAAAC